MSRSSPFFRSPFYGNLVRNAAYFSPPAGAPPAKPKVVSIPVHFVGSDNDDNNKRSTGPSPAAAAIRIQSAFRGFVVRKSMKVVRAIETEVDEIEMRVRRDEKEMDLIVRDEKERLKINEMLMRLLFRLDSVRGVRDYRKRVIRRVITIQEMLDSITAATQTLGEVETLENTGDQVPETMEMSQDSKPDEVETVEIGDQVVETADSEKELKPDVAIEESKTLDSTPEAPETAGDHISIVNDDIATTENQESESVMDAEEIMEIPESTVDSKREEEVGTDETAKNVGMKDVMERMVAENEMLKGLVAELCERSAQQCRLMGGLAERVELLEKIVEKMERSKKKKRRKDSSSPASSIDKKCGRDSNKHLQ